MPSGSKKRRNDKKKKNDKESPLSDHHGNVDTHQDKDKFVCSEVVVEPKQIPPFPNELINSLTASSTKEDETSIVMVKLDNEVENGCKKDVVAKSGEKEIISEVVAVKVEELSLLPNLIPSVEEVITSSSVSEVNGIGEEVIADSTSLSEPNCSFNQSDLAKNQLENFRQMLQKTLFDVEMLLEEFNNSN